MRPGYVVLPLLIAATVSSPVEQPPNALAPYIHAGKFEPGDYRWLRGEFDGATVADKTNNAAIVAWRGRCRVADLIRTRIELTALGINAGSSLDTIPYRSLLCDQVASLPEAMDRHDWQGFEHDVTIVQPIAQGFLAAVELAQNVIMPQDTSFDNALNSRYARDQLLRRGISWANGEASNAPVLSLTPQQSGILVARIVIATAVSDYANTQWLKGVITAQGWPKRTKVGDQLAKEAWLLVQHADADPAFQVRALRLMEPLVATGDVAPKSYAYLYDRVMLKLVGRQRYASQLICRGGRWVPQPLEDSTNVDRWRRQVGLGTLAELQQRNAVEERCREAPADK